jgi:hypothetical protein
MVRPHRSTWESAPCTKARGRRSRRRFPVVTSARRDAARITRRHGAGDVLRPLSRSLAPGIGVTRCPEHRHDQHPEAYESDNHRQDDPRRGAKKLLLRCLDGWRWGHVAHLLIPRPTPRTASMPEAAAESCRSPPPPCGWDGCIWRRSAAAPRQGRAGHIKRGPRRRPVCPRCKGQRRVQRTGSRTVHQAARKIRHGRRAAARYQQEDRDGTP